MSPALGYKFPPDQAAAETHEDFPDANDAPADIIRRELRSLTKEDVPEVESDPE